MEDTAWRLTVSCHFTNETKAFPALLCRRKCQNPGYWHTKLYLASWYPTRLSVLKHVILRSLRLDAQILRSESHHQSCFLWQNANVAWCVRRTGADSSHSSPVTGKEMMNTNWNAGNSIWMSEPFILWVGLTLEQVTQGGYGISILWDSQNLTGHSLVQGNLS